MFQKNLKNDSGMETVRIGTKEASQVINEAVNKFCLAMSIQYCQMYEKDPKRFVLFFMERLSVRMICAFIVRYYEKYGLLEDGKRDLRSRGIPEPDYEGYAKKLNLGKWERVFEKTLNIIFVLTR